MSKEIEVYQKPTRGKCRATIGLLGIRHPRAADARLVQTWYECGAEREVKIELRPSPEDPAAPIRDDYLAA